MASTDITTVALTDSSSSDDERERCLLFWTKEKRGEQIKKTCLQVKIAAAAADATFPVLLFSSSFQSLSLLFVHSNVL